MTSGVEGQRFPERVLVCFAVQEEAKSFRHAVKENPGIDIIVTGMGRRNSESAVLRFLEDQKPSLVLTCGFAGALDPKLKIGDVLFDSDSGLDLIDVLCSQGALPGTFHCSHRVAVTAAEKNALRQSTGADAVEMESSVVRDLCRERKILSATIRVISDLATEDLPLDFNALMTADQNLSMIKLLGALIKAPGKVPLLLKLQRDTVFAAKRLAEVLCGLLSAPRHG